MKTKLLLFLLLAATQLFGQVGFDENIIVGNSYTTYHPQLVKAADLDGDNDLDIITYGSSLNWYENIGGVGNFGEKRVIAGTLTSPVAYSLHVVDLDNDGDLDIIGSVNNKFTTYKNVDGLGNFQVIQEFTLGNNSIPITVTPADMDGDGDLDVVGFYHGSIDRFLVWYENNGTGTLGTEQIISNDDALVASSLVYTEDLDGDNDQDIIIGNLGYGKILWIKNNGNGTFGAPVTISNLAGGITSIATSDMDNDGDIDIISASSYDNQVAWYKNLDGLGTFSDENVITSNATASNAVFVTDINNDNTIDVIYTGTNEIGWLSNTNGLGNFGSQQIITNKAFGVRDVIMADLDGDGKKDLISASEEDDKVAWYKHDGNGNFGRQVIIARSIEFPNNVYPGDFDGDNDIDLLVNSQHDAKLTWFENVNGLGFYGKQHIVAENIQVGNIVPTSYPADIDGDGDLDIASVKDSALLWYENVDGQGNFTTQHIIDSTNAATIIRTQDMDGDGDMDVVCGVYNTDTISWYQNLDNGTFGPEQIITDSGGTNGSLTAMEIADMDGDNDMDIIATNFDWDVAYFENTNGAGSFVEHGISTDMLFSIYPADMDGDGDKDIIGVNTLGGDSDGVVWYENIDGHGNFSDALNISTLSIHGRSIYAADIDNDGDMDVLTAAGVSNSGQLAWYENTGSGTFAARQMIHETSDYTIGMCVAAADVDNDNDMDVLSVFGYNANSTIGAVSVFENLGHLGNTIHGVVTIDSDSNGCTSSDIKGSNLMVISDNGSNSFATFTDQNGAYSVATNEGNFTTAITSQLPDYFVATPASHTFSFTGMNNTHVADFCVAPIGAVNDLDISVYPQNTPRPGFHTQYHIVYRNKGTTTSSGSLNFEYNNNKISFLTASQTVASQTASALTFNFANLHPFETRTIDVEFNVFAPPVTNINDVIITNVTVNPVSGDETEDDNSFTLSQTVIGSFDPNIITCLEGNQVLIEDADKYLHYVIQFQNTGTASAINVKVENTLDSKLDWTSMQLESLSHSSRVEINDGSDVKFIFDNINLPDSTTNEPNSHGFIAYKIKPLGNVAVGDVVHNTANIIFDFNPPIATNTAATQFVGVLSVAENPSNKFRIYPNPTNGLLNIQGNTIINSVSVIDINGRILKELRFDMPTSFVQLDVTDLTKGIYFLKIKSDQGNTNSKIIKR
jgi:uncharacterized repeat protein (TIGR01451 family)